MEYSLEIENFVPAEQSQAVETMSENSVDFDQGSDSVGVDWGLEDWIAGYSWDHVADAAVCHYFLADATSVPTVCCLQCMS